MFTEDNLVLRLLLMLPGKLIVSTAELLGLTAAFTSPQPNH